jgi:hypothetical protein
MAISGCWCDATCSDWGDCCPDKADVCGGGNGEAGTILGDYHLRYYFLADEGRYQTSHDTTMYDRRCEEVAVVPSGFLDAVAREGVGRLVGGRVVEYYGECGCETTPCVMELDEELPWGRGLQGRALDPFRSVAVDPRDVAPGTHLYIGALDGKQMPAGDGFGDFVHDGCVVAADAKNAFRRDTLGLFTGLVQQFVDLDRDLDAVVELREGGARCDPDYDGDADDDDDSPPDPPDDPTGDPPDDPDDTDDDRPGPVPTPPSGQVCFPGPDEQYDACVDLVPISEAGYDYPAALGGSANYRRPIAVIDLESIPEWMALSENFVISELAQGWKGRYAVVQPHLIAKLESLRSMLGPIKVNSGYRPPDYNKSVGGVTHSRHMYGDAIDMAPIDASLGSAETACVEVGGQLVEYKSHVHCDFRSIPVDPAFFGSTAVSSANPASLGMFEFTAHVDEHAGVLTVISDGFTEGAPKLRWTAYDVAGDEIDAHVGPSYSPPSHAVTVDVIVGAQLSLTWPG